MSAVAQWVVEQAMRIRIPLDAEFVPIIAHLHYCLIAHIRKHVLSIFHRFCITVIILKGHETMPINSSMLLIYFKYITYLLNYHKMYRHDEF